MFFIAFYAVLTFFFAYGLFCLVIAGFVDDDLGEPFQYWIRCGLAFYVPVGIIFLAWLWS